MIMRDFIGDIHGQADALERLLVKLGYVHNGASYAHPTRSAVFLGDLIDRGPDQVRVCRVVMDMVNSGNAELVMGNHEFNAVCFMTPDPECEGEYLRRHNEQNMHQHAAFLDQVGMGSVLHFELIEWFRGLPIFIDHSDFRAVHACWMADHAEMASRFTSEGNRLTDEGWVEASRQDSPAFESIEVLLKGPDGRLPEGLSYISGSKPRKKARIRWWKEEAGTLNDILIAPSALRSQLESIKACDDMLIGYPHSKPIFIGHYWLLGVAAPLTPKVACLDYSAGLEDRSGRLCAYRWNGEQNLSAASFVWVDVGSPGLSDITPAF